MTADQGQRHSHSLEILYNTEEGWEWLSGVPDGVEDGWFHQDLAVFGPVPADEDGGGGGRIEVGAIDGIGHVAYVGDETLSLKQARQLRALLDQAIDVLAGYRPPAWMLDPSQLHQRKVEADAEVERRCWAACPACSQEETTQ